MWWHWTSTPRVDWWSSKLVRAASRWLWIKLTVTRKLQTVHFWWENTAVIIWRCTIYGSTVWSQRYPVRTIFSLRSLHQVESPNVSRWVHRVHHGRHSTCSNACYCIFSWTCDVQMWALDSEVQSVCMAVTADRYAVLRYSSECAQYMNRVEIIPKW